MDAGIVLTTPLATPSGGADTSSDVSRDDAEAFAAHLPQEARSKPAPRKAAATDNEDAKQDKDEASAQPQPAPSFSLSSPVAPVLVREDGAAAVLDIALTPSKDALTPQGPAQIAPDAAALALAAALTAAASTPTSDAGAPTAADATLAAPVAAPADAAAAIAAAAESAADANTPFILPGAETAAAQAAPQPKATADPAAASLRNAGKPRGAKAEAEAVTDAKPLGASAAATQAAARSDAKPEFIAASTTPATSAGADTAAQPAATGEAAAVSLEARRAADAPPVAVHRPPSVAATVAQHVIRRFDGKSTSIDVRLDPAELGRVSVKLEVGPDSRVTAVVAADNPATLSDLMRSSRELERALESAGLDLTQGGLSFNLSDRSDDAHAQDDDTGAARLRAGNDNTIDADAAAPASRPFGLESWRGVRVDVTV